MKKLLNDPKMIFGLLDTASLTAAAMGAYLGTTLSAASAAPVKILAWVGILFWAAAWVAFGLMCQRLRKGESAFTENSGRTLRIIGRCMAGLAAVTLISAVIDGGRPNAGFRVIECVIVPGVFLAAALAARVLHGLLVHAMALEAEQEGVV